MRARRIVLISACLLLAVGAWLFWSTQRSAVNTRTKPSALSKAAAPSVAQARPFTILSTNNVRAASAAAAKANQFRYRLSNTTKTIGELVNDRHAILLANALIDTSAKLNLSIPKKLQAPGEPGAYIVQANGPVDSGFRAMLAAAGAQIVSYIPNDAYLVTLAKSGADELATDGFPVIPYEPYYKVSASLLSWVGKSLPADATLNVELFPGTEQTAIPAIEATGGKVLSQNASQNGWIVNVQPPADWTAVPALPGVHIVEPSYRRVPANDLSRATVGVAADTQVSSNYLGLSGSNVLVEVNDSGIDATHPDLLSRVFGDAPQSLVDTDGHGTHVAGTIAGNGTESITVSNAPGSILGTNGFAVAGQFRGMAPLANLYSVGGVEGGSDTNFITDQYLQEAPALTNALISNNSWNYDGDTAYDLAAASYDAAVRDALPQVTGSQPVLFVFSAGNAGNGDDSTDPGDGTPDSIESPATAKNVITVGSIQELRNITNEVTTITVNSDGTTTTNTSAPWQAETSTSYRIAGFSSRGNVGINTEGLYGRFKPDVVTPGTSIISTRSSQWDINAYFYQSPTNFNVQDISVLVQANSLGAGEFPLVPTSTVQVTIQLFPNGKSPEPFPALPIYYALVGAATWSGPVINQLSIPPDGGLSIADILSSEAFYGFNFAVSNITSEPIDFDIELDTITTNNPGNYYLVYSNLDQSIGEVNTASTGPGPYYRYETGTSMSAADASGVLALMQDYFTNTLRAVPSPALLKAMLINGARPTGTYDLQVQNSINYEGWGLVNLPDSLPLGVTNVPSASCASFFLDQNPTNALATGDTHTFMVTIATNTAAQTHPLRVTLAWTDPPGDPAAAIKLVNGLALVVSNLDDPANPVIFYGNDIASGSIFNTPESMTTPPVIDVINNVENVFISQPLGANYSITVIGRGVNVNAVTAQTNTATSGTPVYAPNVVQDFALVVSCGEGEVTNAMTVTDNGIVSNPTTDQQINFVGATNAPLLNQFVGADTPLLGNGTVPIGTITVLNTNSVPVGIIPALGTNAIVTVGMTNQWHFYVITNPVSGAADVTNAGFITFLPDTLSIPRMGVFADSTANATVPEADIDLYVTTDSTLTNLNPVAISNCVHGTQVGLSAGGVFNGASLSRGGTEFVVDIGSHPGQVYYVGVKSETQMASEYAFLSIFTSIPFSQMQNGNQVVQGQLIPANIPDGSPAHPGIAYIFGLAIFPITVGQVVVNDSIVHQNYGDLIGTLTHNGVRTVLNNHDSLGNAPGPYSFVYDDSGSGNTAGSRPSDGPGSLQNFTGTQGIGPWMLEEADTSLTQTGTVLNYSLTIVPHQDLKGGFIVSIPPGTWFYDYIDVSVGYTNLTISATNLLPTIVPPLEMFEKLGQEPTFTDYDQSNLLVNGTPPGNSISVGPPLTPGRYFVGIFNPSTTTPAQVYIIATLAFSASAIATVNYAPTGPVPILDDAVTTNYIFVTNTDIIQDFNVGLRVDHPRISDLVFHLISPDGTRYLLMENRGGTSPNGCGATIVVTNIVNVSSSGSSAANTNYIYVGETSGTLLINYNFYTIPDQMTVYESTNPADFSTNNAIFNSGMVSLTGQVNLPFNTPSGFLTIIMNQLGNPAGPGDLWTYTVGGVQTNFLYLALTEDTNLTTTPIKFAPPPFVPATTSSAVWSDNFDTYPTNTYGQGFSFGGWVVLTNQVAIMTNPPAFSSPNLLALDNSAVLTYLPTVIGQKYILSYELGSSVAESGGMATNANWQLQSYSFTASQTSTPLVLNASGNAGYLTAFGKAVALTFGTNALLDSFSLTAVPGNLYYLPEQDMSGINNQSAYGTWTLEIQDDRAGAGLSNTLLSWQLGFTFANTNFTPGPPSLTGGEAQTNTVCSNSIAWYQVNVPTNAIAATNIILFATAPVNVWYSVNNPPTTNNPGDFLLMANTFGGVSILTSTTVPALVPGGTYYIGVQDTSGGCTTFAIEVDFDLVSSISGPFAFTQPAYAVTGTSAQLNGMATPNGLPTTAWFQWGTNTLYGNQTPAVGVGAGFNVVYTASQIGGLLLNVPYHFRLVVSNAVAVVYGFDQILDEANVVVWGADYVGQANVPSGLSNVVAIAGAYDHSLALKNDATAVGWGDNIFGQATVPSGLGNLLALAGGEYYSMALVNGGTVAAWGANILGQTNVPAGLNNVVMIAGGTYSSLALQNNGNVVAWGAGFFGLTNVPAGLNNIVAIAGGSYHSLAIMNNGTVTAWGDDSAGQTNVPAGLSNVVAIAGGSYHSLALQYDGTVVAWGDNSAGQTNVPATLTNVVAIAAGGFHSLALKNDGTVVAWGDNSAGQASVPVGLSNVVAIASGYFHSLALTPLFNVNSTNPIVLLNGVAQTNSILPGGITYYQVNVPANADFATNLLLFALNGPLNVWFDTNAPPTTNVFLFSGTNGSYTLSTTSAPPLVPGATYYLGVQNTNSFTVTYGIEVDFHLVIPTNAPIFISSIVATNIGGNFGFLLTWYAPTNDIFMVQWTGSINPLVTWNTFTNIIPYTGPPTPTNGLFTFFDDGSQTGGFDTMRFYRLILLTSLTNGVPQTNSVPAGGIDYFLINVPTTANFATNRLLTATGPVNLLFNQTNLPTGTNAGDYTLLAGSTNGASVLGTNSASPPYMVPGGTYLLGVQNTNSFAVTFSLEVDFDLLSGLPAIITLTNGIPYANSNSAAGNATDYYLYTASTNAARVQFEVDNPSGDVVLVARYGLPLPGLTNFNYLSENPYTNGQLIVVLTNSTPVALAPGNWYLSVVNISGAPVSYSVMATEWPTTGGPINVTGTTVTSSDLCLTWSSLPGVYYYVQGLTNLAGTNWVTVSPTILATNNTTTYCVALPSPYNFFQVVEGLAVNNYAPPPVISVTQTNGFFLLQWRGPATFTYQVEWTPSLAPPVWSTVATNFTSNTGLFQFLDNGSLTAPLGVMRFYQLIVLP